MSKEIFSLPIKEKIGQLFFIGIPGCEFDAETEGLFNEIAPGGVCLFSRNIRQAEQTRKLLDGLSDISKIPPFLSLDQEGGRVDRLRRVLSPMPAPNSLKSPEDAEALARITAQVLRILGFNMNFAPVVDVVDERRERFPNGLYSRAFGKSKEDAVLFSEKYLKTLQDENCLGCIKHFPGLGASEIDSHEQLPEIKLNREEFYSEDLFPYRELFKSGQVRAVIAAHANFPLLDLQETFDGEKPLPSSLSYNFMTKLLRDEMNFQGVVITDDLEMGAILKNLEIGDACVRAIAAGVDMLAICANVQVIREGYRAVLNAHETGELTESRIDESLARIASLKSKIAPPLPFDLEKLETLSQEITQLS